MLNAKPVPEFKCPYCEKKMNRIGAIGEIPADLSGNYFCCVECGEIGIFEADQSIRKATPEELADRFSDSLEAKIHMEIFRDFIAWRRRDRLRRNAMNN